VKTAKAPTINFTLEEFEKFQEVGEAFAAISVIIENVNVGDKTGGVGLNYLYQRTWRDLEQIVGDVAEREKFDEKQEAAR